MVKYGELARGGRLYRDLIFGQGSCIVNTGKDIFARDRGVFPEDAFNAVAAGKHPQDLIYGNACPLDAGLPVTHLRVDGDTTVYCFIFQGQSALLKSKWHYGLRVAMYLPSAEN